MRVLLVIAGDNQAQATAITQISAAVTSMDQSTQQNAAMVEQTSAAARNLTNEVERLAEQAAQFRTGRDQRKVANFASMKKLAPVSFKAAHDKAYASPGNALPVSTLA